MKSCLLVIDAQESFRQRPYYQESGLAPYLEAQNALIAGCRRQGIPLVRIFQVEEPTPPDNPFALVSGYVRPIQGLTEFTPAATFHKRRHSALVGTGLDVWLTEQGIRRLIISGIRTEQCCETTTRHASDMGYEVDYVPDATLTFDMPQPDGPVLTMAAIKTRTVAVLRDRFARICTVAEALSAAAEPVPA